MAETGVLGRLPKWPRNALNNSVIAAEQAYRKRSGLPLLSDADIEALKAGVQMSWETGDGASAPAPAAPAPVAAPVAAAPAAAACRALQLPPLLRARSALKFRSRSMPARSGASPPSLPSRLAASATIFPRSTMPKSPRCWANPPRPQLRRPQPRLRPPLRHQWQPELLLRSRLRRRPPLRWRARAPRQPTSALPRSALRKQLPLEAFLPRVPKTVTSTAHAAACRGRSWRRSLRRGCWRFSVSSCRARLFEPATSFKIGYPSDFGLGVDTKFQQKFRIWVDRTPDRIFVIYARCTHLGCTPDWKPAENKFKCPCHGSGYDSEGINFEGPAPRPMDRARVQIAPDGQILVDVAKLYQWPKGQPTQFNEGDGTDGAWLRA